MKKQTHLSRFALTLIALSLLIHACSMNSPENSVTIGATSTPTASSGSSNNNPTATATSILAEVASPVAATPIQNLDPCAFFTATDAEPIVGTALIDVKPGNDIDEVTGGPLEYCTFKGDDVALVVSFVKSNAVKDSQEWQDQLPNMAQATDSEAVITKTPGLGERSFWGVTENSAGWFVAKYPYVFALVVGGNIGYSEDYREDLTALAQKILDQLP